jgi:hypothetical protein
MRWRAFSSASSAAPGLNGPIQKMLVNTTLSNQVSSRVGCSMSHPWHMESDVLFVMRSCVDRRRRSHCVPIRCVARSKRASRRTVRRTATSARPPKPTSAAPAECFQRAVRIEYFDADAGPRVDVKERLALPGARFGGLRCHHAALSAGSARAKPRR